MTYKKLELLDLSFNYITEHGAEFLAYSLVAYQNLHYLKLDNNKLKGTYDINIYVS